jgi:hypothetical protein
MKRFALLSLFALLGFVSIGGADLVTPREVPPDQVVMPFGTRAYLETFKANVPAKAEIFGRGESCLALYVFDAEGNCVARDDVSSPITADDAWVEWVPPTAQRYSVEVRNAGGTRNIYQLFLR